MANKAGVRFGISGSHEVRPINLTDCPVNHGGPAGGKSGVRCHIVRASTAGGEEGTGATRNQKGTCHCTWALSGW